jgi:3-hydroxyethyl bacteriochlorophyllide a dehydrogenase
MHTLAILLSAPGKIGLDQVELIPPTAGDLVVDVDFSGISSGTERLLWTGRMPHFPGMGYPLVPGYESVGRVVDAGADARHRIGETVFVPGSTNYVGVRGLFGGSARTLVVPSARVTTIAQNDNSQSVLLALAATAFHAMRTARAPIDLVVGHGALGRLLARIIIASGHPAPTVWETNVARHSGSCGYDVTTPADDPRKDYRSICDVSGSATILDDAMARLARGGEIILAGFYEDRPSFAFAPAFMREASIRIAAQWEPADLYGVQELLSSSALQLDQIITHTQDAAKAAQAYRTAFEDLDCLKMVLDWRMCS